MRLSGITLIELARGNPGAANAALKELLTTDDPRKDFFVASAYAARGDSASAIVWLERARQAGNGFFGEASWDPSFNVIRSDPAFVAYLRRVKLPRLMRSYAASCSGCGRPMA